MLITQDDRRAFRRMAVEADVKITKNDQNLNGICKDLSSTGMSVQMADLSLQADDEILIELDTKHSGFPPLIADAKVVRVLEGDACYVAAIEFIQVK